jgi:hypothetical protein
MEETRGYQEGRSRRKHRYIAPSGLITDKYVQMSSQTTILVDLFLVLESCDRTNSIASYRLAV